MLGGFRAANDKFATHEVLVMEFLDRALRFFRRQHLHKRETFAALIVFVGHDFRRLHGPNAVEELEQVALRGIERQVADVETARCYFDVFRPSLRTVACFRSR